MEIVLVLGTRPELVKLAPLAGMFGDQARVVHTGQHYSDGLYRQLLTDLRLRCRLDDLGLRYAGRGAQLGAMVSALDKVLTARRPDAVIVQGDTTSALAGGLAANANGVPLVHVEAGLRSYDRAMPEEHNRVLLDQLADLCCAPTSVSRDNLLRENISADRITVTGNTVVEAMRQALPPAGERAAVLDRYGLTEDSYVVATFHRPENVDTAESLETVLSELARLPLPVVLPLHPRTRERINDFRLGSLLNRLRTAEPLGYRNFLALTRHAAVLVSDSGGIQEEASVLKRPIVVVRRSTERPEIEGSFGTLVAPGPRVGEVVRSLLDDLPARHRWLAGLPSPYGDGLASERIAETTRDLVYSVANGGQGSPHATSRAAR